MRNKELNKKDVYTILIAFSISLSLIIGYMIPVKKYYFCGEKKIEISKDYYLQMKGEEENRNRCLVEDKFDFQKAIVFGTLSLCIGLIFLSISKFNKKVD